LASFRQQNEQTNRQVKKQPIDNSQLSSATRQIHPQSPLTSRRPDAALFFTFRNVAK
jgi:hypothetical protein